MSECRACWATIRFVTLDTGRPIPVEPHPSPDRGSVGATSVGGKLVGHVITDRKPLQDGERRYVTHFATCHPGKKPSVPTPRPPSLFDEGST